MPPPRTIALLASFRGKRLIISAILFSTSSEPLWLPGASGIAAQQMPYGTGYPLPYIFPIQEYNRAKQAEAEKKGTSALLPANSTAN